MSYREEDFANMLFGRLVVEGLIPYLNELDPTHVSAQPASINISSANQTTAAYRASLPSGVLHDLIAAPVLLELDPTHLHAR